MLNFWNIWPRAEENGIHESRNNWTAIAEGQQLDRDDFQ